MILDFKSDLIVIIKFGGNHVKKQFYKSFAANKKKLPFEVWHFSVVNGIDIQVLWDCLVKDY